MAVHAGAGSWGLLAAPFFVQGGIFFGGGESALKMLMWNAIAGGAIIVWYAVTAVVIFGALMVLRVFRVNEAQEIQGLDVVKHNEPAYPIGKHTSLTFPHIMLLFLQMRTSRRSNTTPWQLVLVFSRWLKHKFFFEVNPGWSNDA